MAAKQQRQFRRYAGCGSNVVRACLMAASMAAATSAWGQVVDDQGFDDLAYIVQALNTALETTRSGTETTWHNPSSGHHGIVVPSSTFSDAKGRPCRTYKRTWRGGGAFAVYRGAACRSGNQVWHIQSERQDSSVGEV